MVACGGGATQSTGSTSASTSATTSATASASAAPANGKLPPEVIQRVVRASAASFQQCYDDAAKKDPSLHGRTSTRFTIDRTGHVSISSDLGSEGTIPSEMSKCVTERFEKLEFPPPEGGTVTVVYPLIWGKGESSTGDELAPPGGIGLGSSAGGAAFDKGAAAKAMGDAANKTASCAKPNGPTGAGHIKVTFDTSGHVISTDLDEGPFAGTAVGACIQARFREAHIPPFSGKPVMVGKSLSIR